MFAAGGSSSGTNSWAGVGSGLISLVGGTFSFSGGSWSGAIEFRSGVGSYGVPSITEEGVSASSAKLSMSKGEFRIPSGSVTVESLTIKGGAVTGAGTLAISGSLLWDGENTMSGSGQTVVEKSASATINLPSEKTALIERSIRQRRCRDLLCRRDLDVRRRKDREPRYV